VTIWVLTTIWCSSGKELADALGCTASVSIWWLPTISDLEEKQGGLQFFMRFEVEEDCLAALRKDHDAALLKQSPSATFKVRRKTEGNRLARDGLNITFWWHAAGAPM
jgi:hypothetical protein